MDRDAVLATAGPPARGRRGRSGHLRPCDFFDDLPAGGGGYLLSRVLHDWPDVDARRILAACRRAVPTTVG